MILVDQQCSDPLLFVAVSICQPVERGTCARPVRAERACPLQAHPDIAASFDTLMGPAGRGIPDPEVLVGGGWESVRTVVDVGGGGGRCWRSSAGWLAPPDWKYMPPGGRRPAATSSSAARHADSQPPINTIATHQGNRAAGGSGKGRRGLCLIS